MSFPLLFVALGDVYNSNAEPLDMVKKHHAAFMKRMADRVSRQLKRTDETTDTQTTDENAQRREALGRLSTHAKPGTFRTSKPLFAGLPAQQPQQQQQKPGGVGKFSIFQESEPQRDHRTILSSAAAGAAAAAAAAAAASATITAVATVGTKRFACDLYGLFVFAHSSLSCLCFSVGDAAASTASTGDAAFGAWKTLPAESEIRKENAGVVLPWNQVKVRASLRTLLSF